jgi:hypothetical protein
MRSVENSPLLSIVYNNRQRAQRSHAVFPYGIGRILQYFINFFRLHVAVFSKVNPIVPKLSINNFHPDERVPLHS